MSSSSDPEVHFVNLFYLANPWHWENVDLYSSPVWAKTISVPKGHRKERLEIDQIDVFTTHGNPLPARPKTRFERTCLVSAVCDALAEKTSGEVKGCVWDRVIYGGE